MSLWAPAPGPSWARPHAPTHEAHGPAGRVPDGWCDGRGSRGRGGRCIRHAEATPRAVDPLAVPVIKPAFRAALMPRVRVPPLTALRGRAAALPTVGLPPPAGPAEVEHRPAPHHAAAQLSPHHGSGHRPGTPRRLRGVRRRRGVMWETGRPVWEDSGARPCVRRSRARGARPRRDRTHASPSGLARVGVTRPDQLGARVRGVRPRRPSHPATRRRPAVTRNG